MTVVIIEILVVNTTRSRIVENEKKRRTKQRRRTKYKRKMKQR